MNYQNEERLRINAIKMAYGSLHYYDISIGETFAQTVQYLQELFNRTEKEEFLKIALLHIRAYAELGFNYNTYQELFDHVLQQLNEDKMLITNAYLYTAGHIKLTRTRVRRMIRCWRKNAHTPMSFDEVVDDIIEKVSQREAGIYTYVYSTGGRFSDVYELVVSDEQCFFRDVNQNRYYCLEG